MDNLDLKDNLKYSRNNNDSTTLVTFDIKNLYKSNPHDYDLEAKNFYIGKHPDL